MTAALIASLAVATLMWGGAGLPLVLPVAAVGLGIAVWMDYRRRRPRTSGRVFARERQRSQSNAPESSTDEKQPLY